MRITYIWILLCLSWEIRFTQASLNGNNITSVVLEKNFLVNLKINAFLDDHRLIRLNISWENFTDPIEHMYVSFIDGKGCSAIEDIDIFPAKESSYLIRPSPDLTNPVDILMNGCKYEIIFDGVYSTQNFNQLVNYTIPDCVQDKCKCRKRTDSPHEIGSITSLTDGHYFIRWLKKPNINITIIDISYKRQKNSTTFTNVKEESTTDTGIKILLTDIKEDVPYTVIIRYSLDGCIYVSSRNFTIPKKSNVQLIILITTLIIALILLIIVILSYKYLKKLFSSAKGYKHEVYPLNPLPSSSKKEVVNPKYVSLEFLENAYKYDDYELPRRRIIKEKILGEGEFGVVYEGRVFELGSKQGYTKVAIKELRENSPKEGEQDLLDEMEIMKIIGHHDHIIGLLGCVRVDRPLMMILELADISLKNYLMQLRKRWSDRRSTFFFADYNDSFDTWQEQKTNNQTTVSQTLSPVSITSSSLPSSANTEITTLGGEYVSRIEAVLDHNELHRFAVQIARGMEHLEKINITHRDLATRNVLMMADGRVLKISDFGLSRDAIYSPSGKRKMPLRWWPIEAIEQRTWSSKSDVWSFGIVLWEIGTLGAFPYNKTPDTLLLYDLKMGKRLERPKICTDGLYKLMLDCWSENPERRPSFADIVEHLDEKKKKIYVDFNGLNPTYDFPPATDEPVL
ncbi:unnamed protein product [Phyllotreta striolata]|uniref:Protein kinase domain-containing protein n=1 Tax=Phyllotreta striolata TaxID=444603 RepID=A0A9N9TGM6_PHYSR|nr:unnamed protein product [Phyllotreta striolata]